MWTPRGPELDPPNPEKPPYTGILFLDTMFHARDDRERHTWAFRVGLVGPSSYAQEAQDFFQSINGGDDAQGWDSQVPEEIVLNASYEFRYRYKYGTWRSYDWDLQPILGASLGTYASYVNTGGELRFGKLLPQTYGISSYRSGLISNGVSSPPKGSGLSYHTFLATQGWAVGRYLPYDGSTWKNSPSVDKNNWVASFSGGFVIATGSLVLRYTLTFFTDRYDGEARGDAKYGTVSLSW
jgi:hypothetical protein